MTSIAPADATPGMKTIAVPIIIAIVKPSRSGKTSPARCAIRMYTAQKKAASSAIRTPSSSRLPPLHGCAISTTPAAASATQRPSSSRREKIAAIEIGPMNSIVVAIPTGRMSIAK